MAKLAKLYVFASVFLVYSFLLIVEICKFQGKVELELEVLLSATSSPVGLGHSGPVALPMPQYVWIVYITLINIFFHELH